MIMKINTIQSLGILGCDELSEYFALKPEQISTQHTFETQYVSLFPQAKRYYYPISLGKFPHTWNACDAYIITGSRANYDDGDAWIVELKRFLRQCISHEVPLIGICFGHQVIAHLLGASIKNCKRPFLGIHHHILSDPMKKVCDSPPSRSLNAVGAHQQYVTNPSDRMAVFSRDDQGMVLGYTVGKHIICIQSHPELNRVDLPAIADLTGWTLQPDSQYAELNHDSFKQMIAHFFNHTQQDPDR